MGSSFTTQKVWKQTERLLSPILDRSVSSKGNSAYKNIFDMTEENQFTLPAVVKYYGSIEEIQTLLRATMQQYITANIFSDESGYYVSEQYYLLYQLHECLFTIDTIPRKRE